MINKVLFLQESNLKFNLSFLSPSTLLFPFLCGGCFFWRGVHGNPKWLCYLPYLKYILGCQRAEISSKVLWGLFLLQSPWVSYLQFCSEIHHWTTLETNSAETISTEVSSEFVPELGAKGKIAQHLFIKLTICHLLEIRLPVPQKVCMLYFHKLHKVATAKSSKASSQDLGTAVFIPFPSTVQPMQNFQCPPQSMNPCLTKTSLPPPPLSQWLRLIKITSLFLVPHLQHTPCTKAHTPAHIWNPHPTTLSHPTFLLQFLHSPILGWQSQSKPTQVSSTFTYASGFSQDYFELVLEGTRTRRSKVALLFHQHSLWQRWGLSGTKDQPWPDMWWGETLVLHCTSVPVLHRDLALTPMLCADHSHGMPWTDLGTYWFLWIVKFCPVQEDGFVCHCLPLP